ncbi:metallophosphoesterase family protein [Bacillus horti]|uniref:Serine/threonine protein phosphatase 1 n=1 Tax=Caldalkalibacillus horti TaxID=77523 RepID=A0ABT9W2B8_9BACI|nr:metallophosphoesterase family protein [Bacillus horti]MDQ0167398.1 serine/threonine protein phosphatase 1 [Bacillus horti]
MKRILAISDIHGKFEEFMDLLEIVEYSAKQDQLILLGDYTDRGADSKEVVEHVMDLVKNGAIALRGNHDQMLLDWLETGEADRFIRNGGLMTVKSYCGSNYEQEQLEEARNMILKKFAVHVDFMSKLPYYHETEKYIFVHAGINPAYADWKETPEHEMIWIREVFFNYPTNVSKKIVFGHTSTIHLHESKEVWFAQDKIGIDGGCVYGHQLNCLEISELGYKTYAVSSKITG